MTTIYEALCGQGGWIMFKIYSLPWESYLPSGWDTGMSMASHSLVAIHCVHSIRQSTRLWARKNKMPSLGICVVIVVQVMNWSEFRGGRNVASKVDHEKLLGSISLMHNSLCMFSILIILHFETCKSMIIYNFLNVLWFCK